MVFIQANSADTDEMPHGTRVFTVCQGTLYPFRFILTVNKIGCLHYPDSLIGVYGPRLSKK